MTNHNRKPSTAAELQARLAADPEFQARKRDRDEHFRQLRELLRVDGAPIVGDLVAVGMDVKSVWDLVNTKERYPAAIPVLVEHLQRQYLPRTREGIARALTVPEARGTPAKELIRQIQRSSSPEEANFRWACANALTVAGTREDVPAMEAILTQTRHASLHDILKRMAIPRSLKRTP